MNLLNGAKGLVVLGKAFVMAYRPELLLGASLTATVATGVLAAKGGYEARGIVDEAQAKQSEPLTKREMANLTWHCYWPAAAASLTAMGSTTGLHVIHVKEKKQLAAMALLAIDEVKEDARKQIEEKVGPLTKDQQEKAIEDKDKKKTGSAKVQNTDGEIEELFLVRDPVTGRDIWSNRTRINQAMVEIGNIVNGQDNASLNHFYDEAGWARTRDGDRIGWSGILPEVSWHDENGQPITGVRDDGRPYVSFRFRTEPEKGFDD